MPTTIRHRPTASIPNPTDRPRRRSSANPQPQPNLLMENVRILKRGEPLTPFLPHRRPDPCPQRDSSTSPTKLAPEDLSLGSTNRIGPDPETVKEELPVAIPEKVYSSGVTSPHPSSVPVPGFLSGAARGGAEIATHGLRRLLGIGLA